MWLSQLSTADVSQACLPSPVLVTIDDRSRSYVQEETLVTAQQFNGCEVNEPPLTCSMIIFQNKTITTTIK